jgi:multidrug efflux system membrane fusion protein
MIKSRLALLLVACLFLLGGCHNRRAAETSAEEVAIPVAHPVKRDVTEFVNFTGRTESVAAVDVRARVTGYLMETPFKEGTEIKKGETLFVIDPRPYQAQYDQALGQVNLYQAQLKLAKTTLARDQAIARSGGAGAISAQQLDQDRAAVDEAEARVEAYQASLKIYRLNLDFTRVVAPISGQVSRRYLSIGNLVNQDQTLLTTIVTLNPMNVYFDMEEPVLLRIRRAINENRLKLPEDGEMRVLVGLPGEKGFPHEGVINFINNQVSPTTGSVSVRGVIQNTKPDGGTRLLSPGMFMRIRLPIGKPVPSLLVIDRAIQSDQGIKFVYVVDADKKVVYRRVSVGDLQEDGLRVIKPVKRDKDGNITEGVAPDEFVVVGALQQVRPRMTIKMEPREMPTTDSIVASEEGPAPAGPQAGPAKQNAPAPKAPVLPAPVPNPAPNLVPPPPVPNPAPKLVPPPPVPNPAPKLVPPAQKPAPAKTRE